MGVKTGTVSSSLRAQLVKLLSWEDAHASFDSAVADLPVELRTQRPAGLPYSPWQLVEHLRITQHDILDFCLNPEYAELNWPDDYWPASAAPPDAGAWGQSIRAFQQDRNTRSHKFYRAINEIPFVIAIVIVIAVIVKPF